jgi:hypothetical protein
VLPGGGEPKERSRAARDQLRGVMLRSHLAFLSALALSHEAGDYLCVGAGISPRVRSALGTRTT